MIELGTRLFVSLLVLLAAAPEASPQTASSSPPASQAVVRKTGKTGNSRSSPARNSMAARRPCSASNLESAGNVSLPGSPMDLPLGTRVGRPAEPIHHRWMQG